MEPTDCEEVFENKFGYIQEFFRLREPNSYANV